MGAGAKFISLTCAVISILEVFSKPLEQDLFLSLTSRSTEKHIITAIVSDKVSCKDGHCGRSHTKTNPDDMGKKIVPRPFTNILHQPGSLPRVHEAIPGRIPVNAKGQRLDYYTQMPSISDWQDYMWRIGKDVKPCRLFHLANGCRFGDDCCYGHSDISPQVLEAFRYTVKRMPCSKGSHCPLDHCIYGHVCQKPNCITDDPTSCSMRKFHGVDLAFASWKKGKHAPKFPTGGPVQSREKDVDEASATSFWF
jgi:hypothetical protein